jgi:hypothetical protein
MSTPDIELLISRLSGPLDPADRPLFRRAAEAALAGSACWGEGQIYRTVTALWRGYFHPPPDMRHEIGQRARHSNKLINQPPIARSSRSDEL